MKDTNSYSAVLQTYFDGKDSVAAKMLNQGYLTKPAKTAGFGGKEYLTDQSLYVHIVNGVFAVTRLLDYLAREGLYQLTEEEYRAVIAIYSIHDLHKDPSAERGGRREFDITLNAVFKEAEALGLLHFAEVSVVQMRIGMMHLNKKMVGDYSDAPPQTSKLINIVRLADTLASMQEPAQENYRGLIHHLNSLSPQLVGRYQFYYHELNEYRGISTQMLHLIVSEILEKHYRCYPLLFFANGVLYLGPADAANIAPLDDVVTIISTAFFAKIQQTMQNVGLTVAREALNPQQTVKFEQYVYLFANASDLLNSLASYATRKAPKRFITDLVEKRSQKRPLFADLYPSPAHYCRHYGIEPEDENDGAFAEKWWAVSQLIKGVESVARDLLGDEKAFSWIFETLQTPEAVRSMVLADEAELRRGGVADHCLVLAYHYLRDRTYRKQNQTNGNAYSVRAVELGDVLDQLQEQVIPGLQRIADLNARQKVVDRELALTQDLSAYLLESLHCSHPAFAKLVPKASDVFSEYQKRKTGGSHQRLCVLCGRVIPAEMRTPTIKTGILEDQALVFSNKLVPRETVAGQMVWCPMCYLEFTLRQLNGLGYPQGADSGLSDRLYLYLFPDYFFTPEQAAQMSNVLNKFRDHTKLKLRRYGKDDDPSFPTLWMSEGRFSAKMQREALETLRREAERLAEDELDVKKRPTGRKNRDRTGDRVRSSRQSALNYYLIVCEKSTSKSQPELAPTRSELWCKALYTGLITYLLLGVRVYITDKPYLTVSSPTELKHLVTLDAPHSLLRGLLSQSATSAVIRLAPVKGDQTAVTVQNAMDAFSALWVVNENLTGQSASDRGRNLDKQVGTRLGQINSNPLAGAAFYKERQRDDLPASPEFTKACAYLLDQIGGWKLDLVKTLAHQSLAIFLPSVKDGKGKANQYERLFRLALETLKRMPQVEEASEMKSRIAGALVKSVMRQDDLSKGVRFAGKLNCYGDELKQRAAEFAGTIVDEFFIKRCGRNISKLLVEENSLADGIFFVTDCDLGKYWVDYRQRRDSRKAALKQAGQEDIAEDTSVIIDGSH
jgi:hypothetical protein